MEADSRRLLVNALARVAAAERNALQAAYRPTSAKLFGVCLRILGDRAEAKGGSAQITIQNVNQSNGVIHVEDTVLLPG